MDLKSLLQRQCLASSPCGSVMKKPSTSLLLLLFGMLLLCGVTADNDVFVKDLKLFVGGYEFVVKGMAYNPVPIGAKDMDEQGNGGTGLCSPRLTPFGEWKSACFDSDYFDGSIQTNRHPPGPPKGWFYEVWMRDLPLMKEAGVNTVRLYNANPVTQAASQKWAPSGTYGVTTAAGKYHVPFFDAVQQHGMYVIYPLLGDATIFKNYPEKEVKDYIAAMIDEVGNHPALIMYTVGNELDLAHDEFLLQLTIKYINFAREYQLERWHRNIPITSAVVDLPDAYERLVRDLPVDVFTANAGYRGYDFQDFWVGGAQNSGFFNLSCTYDKPVLIGEIGWHQINDEQNNANPDWFNRIWMDLVLNIDQGCIGGVFFEYNDEPLKSSIDQRTMGIVKFSVATDSDGFRSDEVDVWIPDAVTKKRFIFDAVCCGKYEGLDWNFNTDVFARLGRPRAQYDFSSSPCTGKPVITGATISTLTSTFITTSTGPTTTHSQSPSRTTSPTSSGTGELAASIIFLQAALLLLL